jgi:ribosome biogenesis protein BRX1
MEIDKNMEEETDKQNQSKWTDRERVLLLCSRGSVARTRHLVNDLQRLMPHVRMESKYGKNGNMADDLNEMCELSNCTKCIYFESRKGRDVYMVFTYNYNRKIELKIFSGPQMWTEDRRSNSSFITCTQ